MPAAGRSRWLRRWWLDRSVRAKGLIVVVVPLIALIGTTSASLALQYSERQERSAAVAASGLSSAAGRVLADAVNAESGVRGYAATGRPLFLAPYRLALTRIDAERKAFRAAAVTEDDARQQRLVDATTGRVLAELTQLSSAVSGGVSARGLLVKMQNTKTSMDLLRSQVAALDAGPAASLTHKRDQITMLESAIRRTSSAFSHHSSDSAPGKPRSKARGWGCLWPKPSPRP
ncbi:MAG TPA: CHASE3 domain-containing protein [Streptosporangiaceae bacterium]